MKTYGLIGKNIDYSFSRKYFNNKFELENCTGVEYVNFDIPTIDLFPELLTANHSGYNVTIPYKESIIPFLDELSREAKAIGAVNTIKRIKNQLIGFNTDTYGFTEALLPLLPNHKIQALILGNGGSSKAVAYSLKKLNIEYQIVARHPKKEEWHFSELNESRIKTHLLIINCTPLGTSPDIHLLPPLPYDGIGNQHILFDLIYNPAMTAFLQEGQARQATVSNGYRMLELQAEKSWEIWQNDTLEFE